jgi:hypothetical protein
MGQLPSRRKRLNPKMFTHSPLAELSQSSLNYLILVINLISIYAFFATATLCRNNKPGLIDH